MKVGHTLYYLQTPDGTRNASVYRDSTAHVEGAVLLTVAVVGGVGNLLILLATASCSTFRTTSCAFLAHHCLLDSLKAVFCVPFACALLLDVDIPHCNALGAAYIFLMTLTAYNLLAIHINEEYQLTDRRGYVPGPGPCNQYRQQSNSLWCVSFGIFMIWFTTVLLHLGVAFLPSSAQFNYDIGNCVFNYGTPKNYVIHVLWTLLVTAALVIAIVCFAVFFCKLRARMHSEKWTLLHTSISRDMPVNHAGTGLSGRRASALGGGGGEREDGSCYHGHAHHHRRPAAQADVLLPDTEELHYEFAEGVEQTATRQMRLCLRRVVVMLLMVLSFLVCWYPLFLLTLLDVRYTRPPQAYRLCMILAWAHPVTTPLFCGVIYFDMLRMDSLTRSAYSTALPLQDSTSFSSFQRQSEQTSRQRADRQAVHRRYNYKMYDDLGFTNENFSFSNHGSPANQARHEADCMELYRDAACEGGKGVTYDAVCEGGRAVAYDAVCEGGKAVAYDAVCEGGRAVTYDAVCEGGRAVAYDAVCEGGRAVAYDAVCEGGKAVAYDAVCEGGRAVTYDGVCEGSRAVTYDAVCEGGRAVTYDAVCEGGRAVTYDAVCEGGKAVTYDGGCEDGRDVSSYYHHQPDTESPSRHGNPLTLPGLGVMAMGEGQEYRGHHSCRRPDCHHTLIM